MTTTAPTSTALHMTVSLYVAHIIFGATGCRGEPVIFRQTRRCCWGHFVPLAQRRALSTEPSAQVTGTTTTGKGTYFTKRLSIIAHPRVVGLLAGPIGPSVLEARRSSDAASAGERCSKQAWVMPSELSVSRNSAPFHFSAGSKLPTSLIASPVPAPVVAVPACRDEEFQLTHVIEMPCGKTSITRSILVPFERRLTPRGRDVLDSFFHLPHIEKGLVHISRVVGSTATATEPINSKD